MSDDGKSSEKFNTGHYGRCEGRTLTQQRCSHPATQARRPAGSSIWEFMCQRHAAGWSRAS